MARFNLSASTSGAHTSIKADIEGDGQTLTALLATAGANDPQLAKVIRTAAKVLKAGKSDPDFKEGIAFALHRFQAEENEKNGKGDLPGELSDLLDELFKNNLGDIFGGRR